MFWFAIPLILCHFVMVERKHSFLLERGPFLVAEHLNLLEKALYCLAFPLEVFIFLVSICALLEWASRALMGRFSWVISAAIALCYFGFVTAQYEVFRYIKDALTLAVIRSLGGGRLWQSFSYIRDEVSALLPLMLAAVVILGGWGWVLFHSGWELPTSKWSRRIVFLSRPRNLLISNLLIVLVVPALSVLSFPLRRALRFTLVHEVYILPVHYLTDFDGDGFSLVSRPADFAPFDGTRHPYALEIPGNGIDEDGIGGDLKEVIRKPLNGPWAATRLERRNVVLIVLESARADLLTATVDGQPVMPTLKNLPGHDVSMFSHAGFTSPSVSAMMTGSLFEGEGISLVDRFKGMGYRTGVFSAQAEDFGGIAANGRLRDADTFLDANSFPKELRMYSSQVAAALAVPARGVNAAFVKWCERQVEERQPFFAYLNWQELHFPYYYQGEPRVFLKEPIPRSRISADNREWLKQTYFNGARSVDDSLADLIGALDRIGIRKQTTILVIGDHGEELFDHGYLGHGTNISYEQNGALCKLINSSWSPPPLPMSPSDVSLIIHNALAKSPQDNLPIANEVFCHVGNPLEPSQIGLFTPSGLVRYNFDTGVWTRQSGNGSEFSKTSNVDHAVHVWESLLIEHSERSRARQRVDQR